MPPLDVSLQSTFYGSVTPASQLVGSRPGWYVITTNAVAFTALASNDTFTTTAAHGLSVNNWLWRISGPGAAGMFFWTRYYVQSVPSSTTFKITTTPGGTAVDITSDGNGTYVSNLTGMTHTHYMQPQRYGEMWQVNRVTVQSDSVTMTPTVSIYKGVISPSSLIDQTQNGNQDTDDLSSPLILNSSEPIIVQFTLVDVPTSGTVRNCFTWLGGQVSR